MLNRLTWAGRPEDLARIREMGIEGYIDWQLHPEQIDDPLMDAYLANHPMSLSQSALSAAVDEDYGAVEAAILYGRLHRAAYSERQLYELVVEFWTDHFNIPIGDLIVEKTIDDREVIRKHALGTFRDLLFASAQSEAMLYYLSQAYSEKEHPNENYSREVMELHTLGVKGGYTEKDVREVARALTGWTVYGKNEHPFYFDLDKHDTGEKTVLGVTLPAGRGIEDGLDVLDILARHPATAAFISGKLCRRFVADAPPESLIQSTTAVFTATGGDIRQVLRHILLSSEFMASSGAKLRRPMDYVVGAMRLLRPTFAKLWHVLWQLKVMGQLPYYWHPPNGYPDMAGAWISTSGLLARWNYALMFSSAAAGEWEGVKAPFIALGEQIGAGVATAGELVDAAARFALAGGTLSAEDRRTYSAFVIDGLEEGDQQGEDTPITPDVRADRLPALLALIIASPYFQWK